MEQVFVGKHVIQMAEIKDIPFVMDFFDRYWERGCLLSRDRAYFEYEFLVDGRVNVVIAVHKDTGFIDAVVGLIQCSKRIPFDGFCVMWVCKPKCETKFLGMAIMDNLYRVSGARHINGVGLNRHVGVRMIREMYEADVHRLNHYYRLASRESYRIAEITELYRIDCVESSKKLIPIPNMRILSDLFDLSGLPDTKMYKDSYYIEHRYFKHPYYKFNVWGIEEFPGNIVGLLIGRVVCCNGSSALRIVDFFGPEHALSGIGGELDLIMNAAGMEYTDFYCAGIPHEYMLSAGFLLRDDEDKNIIPNHFEPYEKKNIDIFYVGSGYRAFKGDGDQGRPKRLRLPEDWIG